MCLALFRVLWHHLEVVFISLQLSLLVLPSCPFPAMERTPSPHNANVLACAVSSFAVDAAAGHLLPGVPMGTGSVCVCSAAQAHQVREETRSVVRTARTTTAAAAASDMLPSACPHSSNNNSSCLSVNQFKQPVGAVHHGCRAATHEAQRVKAHLSDPDIESKAQVALGETATLISHNNGSSGKSQEGKQVGVLQNFWGTPLFR